MNGRSSPSVADRIASLLDPTPKDFDPEDVNSGFDAADFASAARGAPVETPRSKARSKLSSRKTLRDEQQPELPDAYTGQVVSRAQLKTRLQKFDDDDDDDDDDGSDDEDLDSENEDLELGSDSESGVDLEDDSEDGSTDSDSSDLEAAPVAPQHRQVLDIMAALETQSVSLFTKQQLAQQEAQKEQLEKAEHVRHQLTWWESAVGLRIHGQRLLDLGNQLPAPAAQQAFREQSPQANSLLQEVRTGLSGLIQDLVSTRAAMAEQFPGMEPAAEAGHWAVAAASSSNKRPAKKLKSSSSSGSSDSQQKAAEDLSSEELWERLSTQFEQELSFHNSAIDHWNAQVEASSGRLALRQRAFSAINQGVLAQIDAALDANQDQLVAASRVVGPEFRLLGQPEPKPTDSGAEAAGAGSRLDPGLQDTLPVKELGKKAALPAGVTALSEPQCSLAYNDVQFYQQLLNDLISQKGANSGLLDAGQLEEQRRSRRRAKQSAVDRRASKGRKIRYVVHAKLQGFMAPQDEENFNPLFPADELFTSLFGGRAGMQSGQPREAAL